MFSRIRCQLTTFLIIAVFGMTAYAAEKQSNEQKGFLATHIFDDGKKQFVYTIELPDSPNHGPGIGRPGNVAGQMSGGSNRGLSGGVTAGTVNPRPGGHAVRPIQSRDDMLVGSLEKALKKSGFCREGYKELDRMTEPQQTYLKGQCLDAANARDRKQFPND